jgi:hypothetical protein
MWKEGAAHIRCIWLRYEVNLQAVRRMRTPGSFINMRIADENIFTPSNARGGSL